MSQKETHQTRLSARIVEEGYINLQEAMRTYRQARNQDQTAGFEGGIDPVIGLQDAVQTFFDLVRPYVKGEPRLAEYWHGALPTHPDTQHPSPEHALEYYRENAVGIWQTQRHTDAVLASQLPQSTESSALTDGGEVNPGAWHEVLGLPKTTRVLCVEPARSEDDFDGFFYVEGRFAVLGLRELDRWQVGTTQTRERGNGFMAGETSTQSCLQPEPANKVETAARMLGEVADELGAIATYEPSGNRVQGTPVPDR